MTTCIRCGADGAAPVGDELTAVMRYKCDACGEQYDVLVTPADVEEQHGRVRVRVVWSGDAATPAELARLRDAFERFRDLPVATLRARVGAGPVLDLGVHEAVDGERLRRAGHDAGLTVRVEAADADGPG